MQPNDAGILQALLEAGPVAAERKARKPPEGWQPRLELGENEGLIVSTPFSADQPKEHQEILEDFGVDPNNWTIDRVSMSRWQSATGEWLEARRISLLPVAAVRAAQADWDELARHITRWRPSRAPRAREGAATFVAPQADHQLGKLGFSGNQVQGASDAVGLLMRELEDQVLRHDWLVRAGARFERVAVPLLGDHVEGLSSQGGALIKRTDLGLTEQVRVFRRVLFQSIRTWLGASEFVDVPVIPGNHGEADRVNNKNVSWGSDNWDVDAASAVQDAIAENPELRDRVRFMFPARDQLTLAWETSGTTIGLAHGHQFRGGWQKWWAGQAAGRTAVGDADVLLAGHFHHLHVQDFGSGRLFIQLPALDAAGSQWFANSTGESSVSRALSFVVKNAHVFDLDPVC